MWIARDENGELYAYKYKPQKMTRCYASMWSSIILDRKEYPEVTWENSPKELVVKMVDKSQTKYCGSYTTTTSVDNKNRR